MKAEPSCDNLILIGWREWCALPDLNIPAIKAKIDTGARTSALHAFNIRLVGKKHIAFSIYPIQANNEIVVNCKAAVVDQRSITSSNGQKEYRYIIMTSVRFGNHMREIEVSLSDRDPLRFRMLLGREALKNWTFVNPGRSFCQGKIKKKELKKIYDNSSHKR